MEIKDSSKKASSPEIKGVVGGKDNRVKDKDSSKIPSDRKVKIVNSDLKVNKKTSKTL